MRHLGTWSGKFLQKQGDLSGFENQMSGREAMCSQAPFILEWGEGWEWGDSSGPRHPEQACITHHSRPGDLGIFSAEGKI